VSESPRGPQLYLARDRARTGRVSVEALGAAGSTLILRTDAATTATTPVDSAAWDSVFDVPAGARYIRAELVAQDGAVRALTNPVWADAL
jgi:hypothetical protein